MDKHIMDHPLFIQDYEWGVLMQNQVIISDHWDGKIPKEDLLGIIEFAEALKEENLLLWAQDIFLLFQEEYAKQDAIKEAKEIEEAIACQGAKETAPTTARRV